MGTNPVATLWQQMADFPHCSVGEGPLGMWGLETALEEA